MRKTSATRRTISLSVICLFFLCQLSIPALSFAKRTSESTAKPIVKELTENIKRFDAVDDGIYRGEQPSKEDLKLLKEFGVKTVVNFRNSNKWIEKERGWAEEIGLNYISIPWDIRGKPRPDVAVKFFKVIDERDNLPVFFHCRRGADRTGTIAALYRITRQGVSEENAISEARQKGMHFWLKTKAKNQLKYMIPAVEEAAVKNR